jgi:hypothetical protein
MQMRIQALSNELGWLLISGHDPRKVIVRYLETLLISPYVLNRWISLFEEGEGGNLAFYMNAIALTASDERFSAAVRAMEQEREGLDEIKKYTLKYPEPEK